MPECCDSFICRGLCEEPFEKRRSFLTFLGLSSATASYTRAAPPPPPLPPPPVPRAAANASSGPSAGLVKLTPEHSIMASKGAEKVWLTVEKTLTIGEEVGKISGEPARLGRYPLHWSPGAVERRYGGNPASEERLESLMPAGADPARVFLVGCRARSAFAVALKYKKRGFLGASGASDAAVRLSCGGEPAHEGLLSARSQQRLDGVVDPSSQSVHQFVVVDPEKAPGVLRVTLHFGGKTLPPTPFCPRGGEGCGGRQGDHYLFQGVVSIMLWDTPSFVLGCSPPPPPYLKHASVVVVTYRADRDVRSIAASVKKQIEGALRASQQPELLFVVTCTTKRRDARDAARCTTVEAALKAEVDSLVRSRPGCRLMYKSCPLYPPPPPPPPSPSAEDWEEISADDGGWEDLVHPLRRGPSVMTLTSNEEEDPVQEQQRDEPPPPPPDPDEPPDKDRPYTSAGLFFTDVVHEAVSMKGWSPGSWGASYYPSRDRQKLKVVLVGGQATGKTTLLHLFTNDSVVIPTVSTAAAPAGGAQQLLEIPPYGIPRMVSRAVPLGPQGPPPPLPHHCERCCSAARRSRSNSLGPPPPSLLASVVQGGIAAGQPVAQSLIKAAANKDNQEANSLAFTILFVPDSLLEALYSPSGLYHPLTMPMHHRLELYRIYKKKVHAAQGCSAGGEEEEEGCHRQRRRQRPSPRLTLCQAELLYAKMALRYRKHLPVDVLFIVSTFIGSVLSEDTC